MSKIKLLKVDTMKCGTIRLQSQLAVGRDTVDFIIEEGVLKCWGHNSSGTGFHECNIPYEIVENKSDMKMQPL